MANYYLNDDGSITKKKKKDNTSNKTTLWNNIQTIASDTGKVGENTLKGIGNGIISFIQTLGRNVFNVEGRKKEAETWDNINKKILENKTKDLSNEEKERVYENYNNNPFNYSNIQRNIVNSIEEKNEELQEKKNENALEIQRNANSISNPVGRYIAGEIAPSIGQMLPGMVGGPAGITYFIGSATGNYYDDAIQRGMTEKQATMYSGVMGIIEGSLEAIGADLTKRVGKKLLKKNIKGALLDYGLDIGENFLEESIVEPISEIMATVTAGKDKADWSDIGQRMWQSGVSGAITSVITGGVSGAIGAAGSKVTQQNKYVDYNTNKKLDKNTQNILRQAENIIQENNTDNLPPQSTQNTQNTLNQQIIPTQQENAQKTNLRENVNYTGNSALSFDRQIDEWKNGNYNKDTHLIVLKETPKVYQDLGLDNLPITVVANKLDRIYNENGKQKGRYHGLKELTKQLPEALANPLNIVESNNNSIVIITDLADNNGDIITVSLKMNGKGQLEIDNINKNKDANVLTSAYGRENYDRQVREIEGSYDGWMELNQKNNRIVYDIDEGIKKRRINEQWLELPNLENTPSNITNSIPHNTKHVNGNTTSNYSMQESENNSGSFNFPTNENDTDMIATILEKPAEKVKEKDRSWAIIKANLIDKGMVFEELSRKTGNRELQGKWDYTLTSTARGQNAIGNARYELDPNTKTQKQISKSLTDIINEVGEDTADFYSYMYHQLNIDRMTLENRFTGDTGINYERRKTISNKPVFGESVTAKMSEQKVQELEKKHPEFKEYAQDVYDYLDANTKELVDNGVISKETQQLFKEMYPHYVPISRVRNKGQAINVPLDTGRTGINSPIKKATGGSSDINPLFETMADRTLQTYRASARNSFGVELKNTLGKTNQVSAQTDIDTIMENMTDEEQNKQLLQEGKNGENPTFTVFENGNKITYEITKDMYDALKPKNELLSKIDENKASKIANKINNFRRGLLTEYNPVFSITNAIKDSQDILLNSQHSAKTYAKIPEATAQILSKGYWYNEYIQNGGSQNSYFKDGEFETVKNTVPTKIKNTLTIPLKAISNVNNVIEMTPRLAEYIVSREQGKSIETSMLDAARVTTNFKAGGDITKTLNRNGFTFLNASVQGMQQQIRNIQEANAKGLKGYAVLACKYAIAGVPVLLLNNLLWADDDEYEELQDYVKDNYYIIGKLPNGKFLRIPKGRAVATIQKIVSNVNDFIKNDSINSDEVGKIFWEDIKENIQFGIDNLAPNNPKENNILSPIFQVMTNKTWYGEDLVPTRLQNKPKEEQYDETTDNFSRWLGEKTGISPIKINYLIDQYSGGVGDILLPLGTPQAENNVIEDKFTTDATMKSKYPGEFFAKVDELEINKNSSKATDEDILKYKYISSVSADIGKLYTKKREIQNSALTDKEKKEQLKKVQAQINELAKNSLEEVEKIQNTNTTATIGNEKYYKYHGEWTALSEEEKKKNKNISLKTYADYKNKVYSQTQNQRATGKLSENQSLKNKDKIEILLNSKYSNSEIAAIYENYIKSSTDTEYNIMKATGIDIKEYLKYKQQEFLSDKTDDGTLNGKSISKSKQKKVVEYLNSMNIKGNQRLLLYAMQGYSMTSAQKTQLANYVNGLKIDKNTKLKLYDKFSGFTVYKDGRVQW